MVVRKPGIDSVLVKQVAQMQLCRGKALLGRQPPAPRDKDKGKDKVIKTNEEDVPEPPRKKCPTTPNYNVLAHLRKVTSLLSVYKVLTIVKEIRESFIYALQHLDEFKAYFTEINMKEVLYAIHTTNIPFIDGDLLLGTTGRNRPLYVIGMIGSAKISHILIDPGSSINITSLRMLRKLSLDTQYLSSEKIVISGFNQHS